MNNSNLYSINNLTKLDLINILRLKSIKHCPYIEKITIKFSTNQFKNDLKSDVLSSDLELQNQIKSILLFNILFGFNPKIERYLEEAQIQNNTKKVASSFFITKLILSSHSDIQKFLSFLFIENNFISNISSLKELGVIRIKTFEDKQTLSVKLPVSFSIFNDLVEFFNFSLKDTSLKDLHFDVIFIIKNYNYLQSLKINNIFPFRNIN